MLLPLDTWIEVKDGDRDAFELFKRHYSFYQYKDGRRDDPSNPARFLFVGPGEKMVLLRPNLDGLFVWRKFINDDGQQGINCAVFRNESTDKASWLILEAERFAAWRWPGERLYTYVNAAKVEHKRQPGRCFLKAGWRVCGQSKSGKLVLEKQA